MLEINRSSDSERLLDAVKNRVKRRRDAEGRLELDPSLPWREKLLEAIAWLKRQPTVECDPPGLSAGKRFNCCTFFSELPKEEDYEEFKHSKHPSAEGRFNFKCLPMKDVIARLRVGKVTKEDRNRQIDLNVAAGVKAPEKIGYLLVKEVEWDVKAIMDEMQRVFAKNFERQYVIQLAIELYEEVKFYTEKVHAHEVEKSINEVLKRRAAAAAAGTGVVPGAAMGGGVVAAMGMKGLGKKGGAGSVAGISMGGKNGNKRASGGVDAGAESNSSDDSEYQLPSSKRPKKIAKRAGATTSRGAGGTGAGAGAGAAAKNKLAHNKLDLAAGETDLAFINDKNDNDVDAVENNSTVSSNAKKSSAAGRPSKSQPKRKPEPYVYRGSNKNVSGDLRMLKEIGRTANPDLQLADGDDDERLSGVGKPASSVGGAAPAGASSSSRAGPHAINHAANVKTPYQFRTRTLLNRKRDARHPPSKGGVSADKREQTATWFSELNAEHCRILETFVERYVPDSVLYDSSSTDSFELWDMLPQYQRMFVAEVKKYHKKQFPNAHKRKRGAGAGSGVGRSGDHITRGGAKDAGSGVNRGARYANGDLISSDDDDESSDDDAIVPPQQVAPPNPPKTVISQQQKKNVNPRAADDSDSDSSVVKFNYRKANKLPPKPIQPDDGMFADVAWEQQQRLHGNRLQLIKDRSMPAGLFAGVSGDQSTIGLPEAPAPDPWANDTQMVGSILDNEQDLQDMMGLFDADEPEGAE
eukprot:g8428.t1